MFSKYLFFKSNKSFCLQKISKSFFVFIVFLTNIKAVSIIKLGIFICFLHNSFANFLNSENVCTTQIRRLDGEMPGIYFIETDNEGERSFYYYRSAAAAKKMFEGDRGEILLSNLSNYEWLYLSGTHL